MIRPGRVKRVRLRKYLKGLQCCNSKDSAESLLEKLRSLLHGSSPLVCNLVSCGLSLSRFRSRFARRSRRDMCLGCECGYGYRSALEVWRIQCNFPVSLCPYCHLVILLYLRGFSPVVCNVAKDARSGSRSRAIMFFFS